MYHVPVGAAPWAKLRNSCCILLGVLLKPEEAPAHMQCLLERSSVPCVEFVAAGLLCCFCYSTVMYNNCGRGSQTLPLASEPRAQEGARRPDTYPAFSGPVLHFSKVASAASNHMSHECHCRRDGLHMSRIPACDNPAHSCQQLAASLGKPNRLNSHHTATTTHCCNRRPPTSPQLQAALSSSICQQHTPIR
jgi:hypothetical protein